MLLGTSRGARAVGARRAECAVARQRQDAAQFDAAVEVGAGRVHAVVGQDVAAAVVPRALQRAHAHDAEVRGAAADVGHQHGLLAIDRLFVVERGGDRLVLELHVAESHVARHARHRVLRGGVARWLVVDEEHRPADHGALDRAADARLGPGLQVAQVAADDVEVAHRMAATDLGAALDQVGAEDALHRAHQAAFAAFDIRRDRGAAVQPLRRLVRGQPLDGIEHRSGHAGERLLQRDQLHPRPGARRQRHRRVAGAEVDGAVGAARHGSTRPAYSRYCGACGIVALCALSWLIHSCACSDSSSAPTRSIDASD